LLALSRRTKIKYDALYFERQATGEGLCVRNGHNNAVQSSERFLSTSNLACARQYLVNERIAMKKPYQDLGELNKFWSRPVWLKAMDLKFADKELVSIARIKNRRDNPSTCIHLMEVANKFPSLGVMVWINYTIKERVGVNNPLMTVHHCIALVGKLVLDGDVKRPYELRCYEEYPFWHEGNSIERAYVIGSTEELLRCKDNLRPHVYKSHFNAQGQIEIWSRNFFSKLDM